MAGRSVDVSATPPAPIETWTPPIGPAASIALPAPSPAERMPAAPPASEQEDAPRPSAAGWILGIGGVATLGAGWVLYQPVYAPVSATIAVGVAGGVLATLSLPFLLPRSRAWVPIWSWIAGVGGVGLAALGAWELQFDGACSVELRDGRCSMVWRSRNLSALLFSTAAPLVATPIVYLIRGPEPDRASLSLDIGRGHAALAATGRF